MRVRIGRLKRVDANLRSRGGRGGRRRGGLAARDLPGDSAAYGYDRNSPNAYQNSTRYRHVNLNML